MKFLFYFILCANSLVASTQIQLQMDASLPQKLSGNITNVEILNQIQSDMVQERCDQTCKQKGMKTQSTDTNSTISTTYITCGCGGTYEETPLKLEEINVIYRAVDTPVGEKKYPCEATCTKEHKVEVGSLTLFGSKDQKTVTIICKCGDKPKNYDTVMNARKQPRKKGQ